jgi:hypothetical protein
MMLQRNPQKRGPRFLLIFAVWMMSAGAIGAQDNSVVVPGIQIVKLQYEKQVRLPRNFDPSVIPTGPGFIDPAARTTNTPTNAQDATRAASSAQSSAALRNSTDFPATPRRLPTFYVYSMRIKNTGAKTIEGISWEYIFSDPASGAELGRHQFLSYEKVHANKIGNLHIENRSAPTRIVAASNPKSVKPTEKSIIQCVVYSDNTTWRNPNAPLDACTKLITGREIQKQRRNRAG